MSDLIEKIGKFFADQEAQIQQTYTQLSKPPAHVPVPPPHPVHRVPFPAAASPLYPEPEEQSSTKYSVKRPPRKTSITRRRLMSASEPSVAQTSKASHTASSDSFDDNQHQAKLREISAMLSSMTKPASGLVPSTEDLWATRRRSGDLASRATPRSSISTESLDFSIKSNDSTERPRKPRPPQQKTRKRKKKRGGPKHSGNQESDQPDPEAVAKANAEKVEAALCLAQERARRFQQEQSQVARERELERQESAQRMQEQMMKIEAVRARSFRGSPSSQLITARSCPDSDNNNETESVWSADTEDMMEHLKAPSHLLTELESRLRVKMSLEMHIKEHYIKKHKLRENIRIKLDKALQHNAALRPKVARLSATKAALEMELTAVLADTGEIRQKRRDLEHAADRDRQRRQREAERALQIRLREEEWDSMMEEEKARSEIAAEARAKANHRVEAHSASLRKMLHAYQFYEPRHNNTSSSTQIDNNGSDHGDSEDGTSTSKTDTDDHASKPTQPFQMDFFLPPELAGFEEDGLCKDNEVSNVAEKKESCNSISSPNCANKMLQQALKDSTPFRWRIASFPDQDKFVETIINMVSDDEDN